MNKNAGYLYILTNPSLNGQVKIGRTERHPEDRRKEISSATGVPTPFELVYWKFFEDCHKAENTIHKRLEQEGLRVNNSKEFFSISEDQAKNIIEELSKETNGTIDNKEVNKIIQEGIKWFYGKDGTLKNERKSLDYFENAAAQGSPAGSYWAGKACEKISFTIKRKSDQASWQQKALNHYQYAMNKGVAKAFARSSWLYRKFGQHNEANSNWNEFLSLTSKKENIDKESIKWILKWADNLGERNKKLPDSEIWKTHGKLLIKECNNQNTPKGKAKSLIKQKISNNFKLYWFLLFVILICIGYLKYQNFI